jgi:hypothetical protein
MRPANALSRWALAGLLTVVLTVPAVAVAVPGGPAGGPARRKPPAAGTGQADPGQRRELLKQRIASALTRHRGQFDAMASRVASRIEKVEALAAQVEKAGGDVSGVRSSLDRAKGLLSDAKSLEAEAVAAFGAVPDSANRRGAFAAARAKAHLAASTLNTARLTVRNAILSLRSITNGLKGAAQ